MDEDKKASLENRGYVVAEDVEQFLDQTGKEVYDKLEREGRFNDPVFEQELRNNLTEKIREICNVCAICSQIYLKSDLSDFDDGDGFICKECEDELV